MELKNFFVQRDMAFEFIDDAKKNISSAFSTTLSDGQEHIFSFFVLFLEDGFGDNYVRFTIVPFIEQPYDGYQDSLYSTLGQINHDLPQLKFAFDDDGDLELILDIPIESFDDTQFDKAIQVLSDYANHYYPELLPLVE